MLFPFVLDRLEYLRIDRGVFGHAVRERLHGIRFRVEANIRWRIGWHGRLVVGEKLACQNGRFGFGINQERQVRPIFGKFLVVKIVFEYVPVPSENESRTATRLNGQPYVCFGCVRRKIGVDHRGLASARSQFDHRPSGLGDLARRRLRAPENDRGGCFEVLVERFRN